MKAVIHTEFGPPDVLRLSEVAQPTPGPADILIRVRAHAISYGDLAARNFAAITPAQFNMPLLFWLFARLSFGLTKPRIPILGAEFSGDVVEVGAQVTHFKPGDAVFGYLSQKMGASAEFVCLPAASAVAHKPAHLTYEQAACLPYGGIIALGVLRNANLKPGQKVLIIGASGSVGAAALQITKHLGAEVTAVCSTPRLDYVRALGADHVIDYTKDDYTTSTTPYDVVLDVLGRGDWQRIRHVLTPSGRYILTSFKGKQLLQMLRTAFGPQRVICAMASESPADLHEIKRLADAGHFTAIVDRTFPLDQAAAAHRYAESGPKHGRVVICVA